MLSWDEDVPCNSQKIRVRSEDSGDLAPDSTRQWSVAKRTPKRARVEEPRANRAKKLKTKLAQEKASMLCQNVYGELKDTVCERDGTWCTLPARNVRP